MADTVDLKNAVKTSEVTVQTREYIFGNRYNMYNDNYKDQVKRRLLEIYSNAALLNMDKQIDMTNNVYKTIVDKISRVYSAGVERKFSDESMEDIYKESRVNKYMKQANRYVNAFNDVLMQVAWDSDTMKPRFIFRYPHKTKVRVDGSGNPAEVEYFVSALDNGRERWAFWSKTEHYYKVYDAKGDFAIQSISGNDEMINPYGLLPFVFFQNGFRDGYFWDMYSGGDLVEVTLDVAVYNTFKNYMIKWQSFKQIVVQGTNVGAIKGQILDPSQALTIEGDDVNFEVLDLQANIKELRETINDQATNVAVNYNISPSQFRMTSQVSSGFSLQMENAQLDEFTKEQQSDFIEYEKELYNLIVTIGNAEGASFSESAEFSVNFNDITYAESPDTTANAREKNINLGLTNPVEIIANKYNISMEEAEEKYQENIKYRNVGNEQLNKPTLNETTTAEAMGLNATS